MRGAVSAQASEQILHPAAEELELSAVLHALSDPVRLRIVAELARREGEYTHHFRVLREAGLIHQRPQGTTRLNRLRREDLDRRFPGLLDTVLRAAEAAGADRVARAAGTGGVAGVVRAAGSGGVAGVVRAAGSAAHPLGAPSP